MRDGFSFVTGRRLCPAALRPLGLTLIHKIVLLCVTLVIIPQRAILYLTCINSLLLLTNKKFTMTDFAIREQIETIKRATDKAAQSKETALKFLTDAGIIKETKEPIKKKRKKIASSSTF